MNVDQGLGREGKNIMINDTHVLLKHKRSFSRLNIKKKIMGGGGDKECSPSHSPPKTEYDGLHISLTFDPLVLCINM